MSEVIKQWLCQLYDSEIDAIKCALSDERLTGNVRELEEYLKVLEDLREECEHGGCV